MQLETSPDLSRGRGGEAEPADSISIMTSGEAGVFILAVTIGAMGDSLRRVASPFHHLASRIYLHRGIPILRFLRRPAGGGATGVGGAGAATESEPGAGADTDTGEGTGTGMVQV